MQAVSAKLSTDIYLKLESCACEIRDIKDYKKDNSSKNRESDCYKKSISVLRLFLLEKSFSKCQVNNSEFQVIFLKF